MKNKMDFFGDNYSHLPVRVAVERYIKHCELALLTGRMNGAI
jgi:hypothetical protein